MPEIGSLTLGDRNGSNLGAGSTNPGTYFDIDGNGNRYRMWIYVSGEVPPPYAGRNLIQVTLLSGDTATQAASKIAAALNAAPNHDFTALPVGGAISVTNSAPGTAAPLTLSVSGWGTAVAAEIQAGTSPTGNYLTISNNLKSQAANGRTEFRMNLPTTFNSSALRANQGNNLILKAYFSGMVSAFSNENVYSYEVRPVLNLSDKANTTVDLHFNFSYNQKNQKEVTFDLPPYCQPTD